MTVDVATKVSRPLLALPPGEGLNGMALSPDAREIYGVIFKPEADIVLAKLTGAGK
jgi:hypothetical protein